MRYYENILKITFEQRSFWWMSLKVGKNSIEMFQFETSVRPEHPSR